MEDLRTQLENLSNEDLLSLFREADDWDGSFEFCRTYEIEDLVNMLPPIDLVNCIIYGDVNNTIDAVRFNGYGNLETISSCELYDECRYYLDDIVEWIKSEGDNIDLDCYGIEVA